MLCVYMKMIFIRQQHPLLAAPPKHSQADEGVNLHRRGEIWKEKIQNLRKIKKAKKKNTKVIKRF